MARAGGQRVPHQIQKCEENAGLASVTCWRTIMVGKAANNGQPSNMTSRQSYRVQAHNPSKQSENKIHDDTVARRFGFSGGLVPGVDVMAYMMHLPVEKWARASRFII